MIRGMEAELSLSNCIEVAGTLRKQRAAGAVAGGVRTIRTPPLTCPEDDSYPSSRRVAAVSLAGAKRAGKHWSKRRQ